MSDLRKITPESLKKRWRILRANFGAISQGFPDRKLKLIGVTGTSGKSTTANMVYHILEENGFKVGVVSTIGAKAGKKTMDTGLHVTTPDPIQFQKILKFMVKRGMEYVVVEASSHALAQGRLGKVKFDHSIFTNIKRDHLDWHGSWENYAAAKAELALMTKGDGNIVVNRDDKDMYNFLMKYLAEYKKDENILTYSLHEAGDIKESKDGVMFEFGGQTFYIPIFGTYNIENAIAAITLTNTMGLSYEQIANALRTFPGIEGRMQIMKSEPFIIVVNFAHNTDSIVRSLDAARKLADVKGKVIAVFGSAGLRDVEKRFGMGEAAANGADVIVVTAEDPRTESLEKINTQILEGAERKGGTLIKRFKDSEEYKAYEISPDAITKKSIFIFDEEKVQNRFDAIEFAIKIAKPGDVIITEGKGHEQSLCFGTTEHPFTDQEAVKRALKNLNLE